MDEELKKLFMTMPDLHGKYSAIIQVSGFDSEEQAHQYLYQFHDVGLEDILREGITIH
nr:hypothetical protein [uncultured Mediterranean phage uvMED]